MRSITSAEWKAFFDQLRDNAASVKASAEAGAAAGEVLNASDALRREADGSLAFHGQAVRRTLLHRGTGAEAGEDGWRVWRPASDETGLAAAA